jgi:GNAT superfamily N-acetyltransferase
VYLFASVGGAIGGTAAVYLHGGAAYLFAASTLAEHRGRGVQGALIAARLALAIERGADLAFTVTAAGSTSQRNFERRGFQPVYSQALLIKQFADHAAARSPVSRIPAM